MLESKKDEDKIEAMKIIIKGIIHGEDLSRLLMPIIKFCTQSPNHTLKKLLLIYWEILDMYGSDGKLRPEMILVCEGMKKNLVHPNEYVRGSTLRFLCKLSEAQILQSLIPSITSNLEHRNSYVRKNAVLAVYHIQKKFPTLIPDAADLIEKILENEVDSAARRNAFLMLFHTNEQKAMAHLYANLDQLNSFGESFQLVALELIRKVSRTKAFAEVKSQYLRCIYALTECPSNPVAYEAANTLISLSSAPVAVRRAISAYTRLLGAESDSSVKLIILGRLRQLRRRHQTVLSDMVMDILKTLTTPNNDIRKKTLDLCMRLLSPRNVQNVVGVLKKELVKTDSPGHDDGKEYRKILVESLHKCAVKFPEVVPDVVHLLMNYIGDENTAGAKDVILFVRHIVEEYPKLRGSILSRLLENFDEIRSSDVFRVALWILGEYAEDGKTLESTLETVRDLVGPLPIVANIEEKEDEEGLENGDVKISEAKSKRGEQKTKVLADGTYASQSIAPTVDEKESGEEEIKLRALLLSGDSFLAACLASSVTKMVLRYCSIRKLGSKASNFQIARGLLLLSSLLRIGEKANKKNQLDRDSRQRVLTCIQALLHPEMVQVAFLKKCRESFHSMLQTVKKIDTKDDKEDIDNLKSVDDVITIRQLCPEKELYDVNSEQVDVKKAVGVDNPTLDINSKLSRVYQLTGFADSVYAEAYLTVLDYDILLDILVHNQTNESLQNLTVELNTSGDLKISDRIQEHTIAPHESKTINVSIKVSSTESGVIFGNIVYSTAKGVDKKIVVLNSIHMDIMDYIHPAECTDTEFRSMWAEFEWENKVSVNTDFKDLTAYLNHIVKITNMKCLTPDVEQYSECGFLAANLYACSIFGEDALLNLSVEQHKTGKITGYVRIRSKTQGVALSLGDKITSNQRKDTKPSAAAADKK